MGSIVGVDIGAAARRAAILLLLLLHTPPASALHTVRCGHDCTAALQAALLSSAAHVLVLPPRDGAPATVGSANSHTTLIASGTDQVIEFAAGLELVGFLNETFAPTTGSTPERGYSPALTVLSIHHAANLTIKGSNTVLRRITASVSGNGVRMESLQFSNPGWDGLYARGVVGLTLKSVVFDRPYRNGISVIDAVDMLAEDCIFSNSLPNGSGRVSPMAGVDLEPNRKRARAYHRRNAACNSPAAELICHVRVACGLQRCRSDRPASQYHFPPLSQREQLGRWLSGLPG